MKISVITATLNAATYLRPCLESVGRQEGEGFRLEHIIVDGGSTDDTVAIARAYGCRVLEGRDGGVYDAMDRGIQAATGDVFGCLGGDDVLEPGAARAIARWYAGRRSEWMVGTLRWIDGAGRSLGTIRPPPEWLPLRSFASLGWCCLGHAATFMTKELYRELGGFETRFRVSADYLLLCQALERMPFDRVAVPIAGFRRHGDNLSIRAHGPAARENGIIADRYAPESPVARGLHRGALKAYLNGRNPVWAFHKRAGRLRAAWEARGRPDTGRRVGGGDGVESGGGDGVGSGGGDGDGGGEGRVKDRRVA